MNDEERKARAMGYFEAVGRGDRDALLELFHPQLRWVVPRGAIEPYAGTHVGAELVADLMLGAVSNAFVPGSQRTEILLLIAEGDTVVAETRLTARGAGGRPDYENAYAFFFRFEGDRIAELREYVDTRTAAIAFGG